MRNYPDAVMLFAAGFGTRMRDLTANQPKPLIKIGNKALIDHTIDLIGDAQIPNIVANTHYLPDQIVSHLSGSPVRTILEDPEILETGGGLRNALTLLGNGPVFTANTDAIWKGPNPFKTLKSRWDPERMDALLLCVPAEKALGHSGAGDFILDQNGQLSRGPGVIYGGIQIIKTERLAEISERVFSLNKLWNLFHDANTLFGLSYDGQWCDVGTPEGIPLAETLLD
ncbi:nucleotidyltransferase family protein [Shimia sp. SDUM112013]|uniref:nucleotidyltransferase family protein n=1 Tax=Shimia sp. SDUM112013 TaxID=3136160 RepID=UPI0032EBBB38